MKAALHMGRSFFMYMCVVDGRNWRSDGRRRKFVDEMFAYSCAIFYLCTAFDYEM